MPTPDREEDEASTSNSEKSLKLMLGVQPSEHQVGDDENGQGPYAPRVSPHDVTSNRRTDAVNNPVRVPLHSQLMQSEQEKMEADAERKDGEDLHSEQRSDESYKTPSTITSASEKGQVHNGEMSPEADNEYQKFLEMQASAPQPWSPQSPPLEFEHMQMRMPPEVPQVPQMLQSFQEWLLQQQYVQYQQQYQQYQQQQQWLAGMQGWGGAQQHRMNGVLPTSPQHDMQLEELAETVEEDAGAEDAASDKDSNVSPLTKTSVAGKSVRSLSDGKQLLQSQYDMLRKIKIVDAQSA